MKLVGDLHLFTVYYIFTEEESVEFIAWGKVFKVGGFKEGGCPSLPLSVPRSPGCPLLSPGCPSFRVGPVTSLLAPPAAAASRRSAVAR